MKVGFTSVPTLISKIEDCYVVESLSFPILDRPWFIGQHVFSSVSYLHPSNFWTFSEQNDVITFRVDRVLTSAFGGCI